MSLPHFSLNRFLGGCIPTSDSLVENKGLRDHPEHPYVAPRGRGRLREARPRLQPQPGPLAEQLEAPPCAVNNECV